MATRTQVITVDDLDGTEILAKGKTVTFAHGNNVYEIDLSDDNARKLREALAPYIAVARRVGTHGVASGAWEPDVQEVRAWARRHGVTVSARGRVSQEVQDAYRAAN